MKRFTALLLLPLLLLAAPTGADPLPLVSAAASREDLAVTIYNQDLGLIRDVRRLNLPHGSVPVRFNDVASGIDATSVAFRSLSDPTGVAVEEQNYEYDLITPEKLMEKYVGKELEIREPADDHQPARTVRATLISTNSGYVYRIGDRIYLQPPGEVILPDLPSDLVAQPSLIWRLSVAHGGPQRVEASYLTSGMSWQADYVLVSSPDNRQADLNAWVTLKNDAGASFPDARLTLVAGAVHRAAPAGPQPMFERAAPMAAAAQFTQQNLFEYHAYNLDRRTTLKQHETKQLSLFSAAGVPTRKVYVFAGSGRSPWMREDKPKVQVMLEFRNDARSALGMPLPAGKVRVYQQDASHTLQFIGEDQIDHTPKDETLRIALGDAFDVVGERKQLSQHTLSASEREYSYAIDLRNHKSQDVDVEVVEHVWGDWRLVQNSEAYVQRSADELVFPTRVPANGQAHVTYTVRVKT